jgi:penicillin-binding protein A
LNETHRCVPLEDGRVGAKIPGWGRPIRDDAGDPPHGAIAMREAIRVSCNAYFAQLAVESIGAAALRETADLLDIPVNNERTRAGLKDALPQAAYGQGEVVATPFRMARVAAAVANGGAMPHGRWVIDESNPRVAEPQPIVPEEFARVLGEAMRSVVTSGTARRAFAGAALEVAGKTGTAQVAKGEPHSWFIGFAPFRGGDRKIAFAVVVEHGGYGGTVAAPIARELIESAQRLGLFDREEQAAPAKVARAADPGEARDGHR